MTTVTGEPGVCRVQRLAVAGEPTWTVLGLDHRVVEPADGGDLLL
jgi:hypothetical protein